MTSNTIHHHPDPDLLLDVASGIADPAIALVVETHAALCDECRRDLQLGTAVGAAMVMEAPAEPVSPTLLASIMDQLDDVPATGGGRQAAQGLRLSRDKEIDRLPEPVQSMAQKALAVRTWKTTYPGVRQLDLAGQGDGPSVELMRIEPGTRLPRHTHRGTEYTLVLQGAFRDEGGRFGAGDLSVRSCEVTHGPVAEDEEVCFALAVTFAPIQLTGALGLLQRTLGH